MLWNRFFILLLMFTCVCPIIGQQSTHIGAKEGLNTRATTDISMDSDGCMWIATYAGIYKHEGTRIRAITESDPNNLPIAKTEAHSIMEDSEGNIWAGTLNGLFKIDKYRFNATHYPVKPEESSRVSIGGIYSVFEGFDNDIWLSSDEGMYILDKSTESIRRIPSGQDKYSLPAHTTSYKTGVKTSEGMWMYTTGGMVFYDKKNKHFEHKFHNPRELAIFELSSNAGIGAAAYTVKGQNEEIWFVSNQKWLTRYQTKDDKIDTFTIPFTRETWNCCHSIALDSVLQKVWIGTRHGGLFSFDIRTQQFSHFMLEQSEQMLNSNYINALVFDRYNQLWIGSDNGINVLNSENRGSKVQTVSHKIDYVNLRYELGTLSIIDKKNLIIPYHGGAFFRKDISSNAYPEEWLLPDYGMPSNYVHSDQHELYYAGRQIIASKKNRKKGYLHGVPLSVLNEKLQSLQGRIIWIYSPEPGKIYVKKSSGYLLYMNKEGFSENLFCPGFKLNITATEDNSALWYLGTGYHLIKKSTVNGKEDTIHLHKHLKQMDWTFANARSMIHANNSIWITSQNGLLRYSIDKDSLSVYTVNDGLSASFTFTLAEDNYGNMWVGSLAGVDRFDKVNQSFSGVVTWPVNTYMDSFGGSIKDEWGNIHFVIGNKYIGIYPEQFEDRNKQHFTIQFNKFTVNGETYNLSQPESFAKLKHDQNRLEIHFGLLKFSSQQEVRLLYRINDKSAEWLRSAGDGILLFNALPHGNYTIYIKAQNHLGEDISDIKTLQFSIMPHFRETSWFKGILLGGFLLLVLIIYKVRIGQIKQLERIRTKIATDLHDDVASTVGSISYYSEYGKSIQNPEDIASINILDKIGDTAREAMESMRDVIWSTHAKFDNYHALKQKLCAFAEDLAHSQNMVFIWDDETIQQNMDMSPLIRRNVYLILKEALSNAIKYSHASKLKIVVYSYKKGLSFTLSDNGKGFDLRNIRRGNGLDNMKHRANEMNANFHIKSSYDTGTTIRLEVQKI